MLRPEQRVELVDVVEVLGTTFDSVTADGVLIERLRGWSEHGVRYTDLNNPDEPIREMSATAYTAEFYKVCGGSLDTADFDAIIEQCAYVGSILGSILFESLNADDIRILAGSTEGDR